MDFANNRPHPINIRDRILFDIKISLMIWDTAYIGPFDLACGQMFRYWTGRCNQKVKELLLSGLYGLWKAQLCNKYRGSMHNISHLFLSYTLY